MSRPSRRPVRMTTRRRKASASSTAWPKVCCDSAAGTLEEHSKA